MTYLEGLTGEVRGRVCVILGGHAVCGHEYYFPLQCEKGSIRQVSQKFQTVHSQPQSQETKVDQ